MGIEISSVIKLNMSFIKSQMDLRERILYIASKYEGKMKNFKITDTETQMMFVFKASTSSRLFSFELESEDIKHIIFDNYSTPKVLVVYSNLMEGEK